MNMSLLETINELGPDKTELLYSAVINGQQLQVRQYQNYRWLSAGGEMIQSLIDLEQPSSLLLPNLEAMLAVLEFMDMPSTLLNLGAGGGSIERYFKRNLPTLAITSIEANDKIIELAERFFTMHAADFINTDAVDFLKLNRQQFDMIFIDMYSHEKQPECLYDPLFHQSLAAALKKGGAIAMNLLPHSEEELLRILRPLNQEIGYLLLYMVPHHDNVVVFALKAANLDQQWFGRRLEKLRQQGMQLQVIAQSN